MDVREAEEARSPGGVLAESALRCGRGCRLLGYGRIELHGMNKEVPGPLLPGNGPALICDEQVLFREHDPFTRDSQPYSNWR